MSDIVIPGRDAINRWAYLSAYALAVKHGFVGTEIEWLASLHGEQGTQGDPGTALNYKGEYAAGIAYVFNDCVMYENDLYIHIGEESTTGTAPTDTDTWSMIFSASDAADDIAEHVADAEAAATAAATAQAAAETAKTAAQTAQAAAETAQAAAEEAQGRAEDAVTDAEAAQDAAEDAQTAAETAATASAASATAASGYESSARTHAYNAQVAAGEAGSYASGAQVAQAAAEAAQAGAEEAESDASDAVGAAAGYASDSQAWATGYRGSTPVSSGDQYHNNSKYWADESKAAQIAAQTAKTGAESANTSAQAAKTAAESANTSAQAAKTAAQTAQTGAETAQAAAEAAATTAAEAGAAAGTAAAQAVVADKADLSYAQYIALREEEDRQILFGSVVEAATDTYPELRAAPIHSSITIGQSVYPRMDRTRMAIDAIKGRTVAFNQLVTNGDFSNGTDGWQKNSTASIAASDNVLTLTTGASTSNRIYRAAAGVVGHKHLITATINPSRQVEIHLGFSASESAPTTVVAKNCNANTWTVVSGIINPTDVGYVSVRCRSSVDEGDEIKVQNVMLIDLTAEYGTTLADAILAMETATAGSGVAYVRQRMDLDYYASNGGELKAPVVSGVGFVGFNLWDEVWDVGRIGGSTGQNAETGYDIRSRNYIPVFPNTLYCIANTNTVNVYFYDADKAFISASNPLNAGAPTFTTPSNCHFIRFCTLTSQNISYNPSVNPICVNLSSSRNGEYQPYQHTSLSIPSTRLDGVGTAQDVLFVREDGENDYSLIKRSNVIEVDMGSLNWVYASPSQLFIVYGVDSFMVMPNTQDDIVNLICPKYPTVAYVDVVASGANNVIGATWKTAGYKGILVADSAYSDAATFKTAMSGVKMVVEAESPTETVIAEHLTLAQISAIAENGGIISVVNSNGHIVQPNVVMDTVISRSES